MSKINKKKDAVKPELKELVIKNERILKFYNENRNIDFEKVNLLYIDLLETTMNASLNSPGIVTDIYHTLKHQNNEMVNIMSVVKSSADSYKNEIETLKNLISNSNDTLTNRLHDTKDNYIKELKELLKYKESDNMINLSGTIEKQNNIMMDKVSIILNDVLPKSLNSNYTDIITYFKDDMTKSLNKLLDNDPKNSLDKIVSIIDNKYNNLTTIIENQILQHIHHSEGRLLNNISQIKDISSSSNTIQSKISDDLNEYLNRAKKINHKGSQSENKLFNILTDEYLTSEIINTTGQTAKGDIILKRPGKIPILFENKNYTSNVNKDEVDKFIRDITNTKFHGILLSQTSGIVDKNNFQIDIHDDNILIYIHKADYDITKIIFAINVIDLLSDKIINNKNKKIGIDIDTLRNVNTEYQRFIEKRDNYLQCIKEWYKKSVDSVNDMIMPQFEKMLSDHFANNKKTTKICTICKIYSTEKNTSLARHMRFCNIKFSKIDNNSEESPTNKNK